MAGISFGGSAGGQIALAYLIFAVTEVVYIQVIGLLRRNGILSTNLSRKMVHIGVGAIALVMAGIFPVQEANSGVAAALVPLSFLIPFAIVAHLTDEQRDKLSPFLRSKVDDLVDSSSRTGDPKELMHGPFHYGIVSAMIITYMIHTPDSAIILSCLYWGDGFADIVGRSLGSIGASNSEALNQDSTTPRKKGPLQYSVFNFGTKSIPGSIGYLVFSVVGALFHVWIYAEMNVLGKVDYTNVLIVAVTTAAVTTVVEAVSPPEVDNLLIVSVATIVVVAMSPHYSMAST